MIKYEHRIDVDLILSHFNQNYLFPRKIMTKKHSSQFSVYSRDELIQRCIDSDFLDCRINAYPDYPKWEKHNIVRYPPNFIFIDLD